MYVTSNYFMYLAFGDTINYRAVLMAKYIYRQLSNIRVD
jgi:hypothetical protein